MVMQTAVIRSWSGKHNGGNALHPHVMASAGHVIRTLAEFTEFAHVKRDLMGKFHRVLAGRFFEFNIIAADGMFGRRITALRHVRDTEPGAVTVLVTIDRDAVSGS